MRMSPKSPHPIVAIPSCCHLAIPAASPGASKQQRAPEFWVGARPGSSGVSATGTGSSPGAGRVARTAPDHLDLRQRGEQLQHALQHCERRLDLLLAVLLAPRRAVAVLVVAKVEQSRVRPPARRRKLAEPANGVEQCGAERAALGERPMGRGLGVLCERADHREPAVEVGRLRAAHGLRDGGALLGSVPSLSGSAPRLRLPFRGDTRMAHFVDLDPEDPAVASATAVRLDPEPLLSPGFQPLMSSLPVRRTPRSFLAGSFAGPSRPAGPVAAAAGEATARAQARLRVHPDPGAVPLRALLLASGTLAAAVYAGAGIAGLLDRALGLPMLAVGLAWSGASSAVILSLCWRPSVWAVGVGCGAIGLAVSLIPPWVGAAPEPALAVWGVHALLLLVGSAFAWTASFGFDASLARWRADRAAHEAAKAGLPGK